MKQPTATIYQNETQVMIIFSKVDGTFRGSETSFVNSWSDGGASGISGFDSRKELNQYLKENNFKKKGTSKLDIYCWSKHTLKNQATITCIKKKNHKRKHSAEWHSTFGVHDKKEEGVYEW